MPARASPSLHSRLLSPQSSHQTRQSSDLPTWLPRRPAVRRQRVVAAAAAAAAAAVAVVVAVAVRPQVSEARVEVVVAVVVGEVEAEVAVAGAAGSKVRTIVFACVLLSIDCATARRPTTPTPLRATHVLPICRYPRLCQHHHHCHHCFFYLQAPLELPPIHDHHHRFLLFVLYLQLFVDCHPSATTTHPISLSHVFDHTSSLHAITLRNFQCRRRRRRATRVGAAGATSSPATAAAAAARSAAACAASCGCACAKIRGRV
jgi:hypothetical protein